MSAFDDLANLMKDLKSEGSRFVLMLGAGASIDSKVPDTRSMMKEALAKYGTSIEAPTLEARFDKLMQGPADNRRLFLKRYFDQVPSRGYWLLAELIKDGYFETVITFNFDVLLEQCLRELRVDQTVIVRGEFDVSSIPRALEAPGVKVLKLHGSLKGASDFIFTGDDLLDYPPKIAECVKRLTAGHILVCGYAYNDQCVISSFSKDGPGNVVIVDPNPSHKLRDVAAGRNSDRIFDGEDGKFDVFFTKLSSALKEPQPESAETKERKKKNPFKFLQAYGVADGPRFEGRADLVRCAIDRLRERGPAYFITGRAKYGKTSFVRAGVIPALKQLQPHRLEYLRCQATLRSWLPAELARICRNRSVSGDLESALRAFAQPPAPPEPPAPSYLVLDQFERVIDSYPQSPQGDADCLALLADLKRWTPDTLTIIYVARLSENVVETLNDVEDRDITTVPCHAGFVADVVQKVAAQAKFRFDDAIVARLCEHYNKCNRNQPFTLAHVNAVCHLLYESGTLTVARLDEILEKNRDALNSLINHHDIIGFVEDIPNDEEARALLPRMMKFKEGQNVAECLSTHFRDLFPYADLDEEEGHAAAIR